MFYVYSDYFEINKLKKLYIKMNWFYFTLTCSKIRFSSQLINSFPRSTINQTTTLFKSVPLMFWRAIGFALTCTLKPLSVLLWYVCFDYCYTMFQFLDWAKLDLSKLNWNGLYVWFCVYIATSGAIAWCSKPH